MLIPRQVHGGREVAEGAISSLRCVVFTMQLLLTSSPLLAQKAGESLPGQDRLCQGDSGESVGSDSTQIWTQVQPHEQGGALVH